MSCEGVRRAEEQTMPQKRFLQASLFPVHRLQTGGALPLIEPKLIGYFAYHLLAGSELFYHATMLEQHAPQGLRHPLPGRHPKPPQHFTLVAHRACLTRTRRIAQSTNNALWRSFVVRIIGHYHNNHKSGGRKVITDGAPVLRRRLARRYPAGTAASQSPRYPRRPPL